MLSRYWFIESSIEWAAGVMPVLTLYTNARSPDRHPIPPSRLLFGWRTLRVCSERAFPASDVDARELHCVVVISALLSAVHVLTLALGLGAGGVPPHQLRRAGARR